MALVTGGSSGIGLTVARELLREGARVALTTLPADGKAASRAFARQSRSVMILAGDMADEEFCRDAVDRTVGRFSRLDLLVNNAFSFLAKSVDATRADWHRSFDVGPIGFALMTQLAAANMRRHGGGAIVNVSSVSGWVAQKNRWTYNMAKGAVNQLTKCAALDLASAGIRVNSVSPGWIWTREVDKAAGGNRKKYDRIWGAYHMLGRLGQPGEVAAAILFLLSREASFITGTDLPVDGGYLSLGPEGLGQTAKVAGSR